MKYAICDIETTGGNNRTGKIIEIAIFLVEDNVIIDEFQSLINPERPIPPFITSMTGISEEMVANAPKFFEIAKRIVEITNEAVFVAHNVSFDYNYIATEFARLGYTFQREKMCTLALSRKILPGHEKYSLGNLCDDLGIALFDRHRAAGDARATVDLFLLLQKTGIPEAENIKQLEAKIHPKLEISRFAEIPETTGVYYFFDEKDNIIYIGKSTNLHRRVLDHFYNRKNHRDIRMQELCARIDYTETGSELIALLKESHEIKIHKPLFNRAGRRSMSRYGIFDKEDKNGYLNFYIATTLSEKSITPLRTFSDKNSAIGYMERLVKRHILCQKLCGTYVTEGPCFHHQIKKCNGACVGTESSESYNKRAMEALSDMQMKHESFFISDGFPSNGNTPFVLIENGSYKGYGLLPIDSVVSGIEDCYTYLEKSYFDDKDANAIIQSFMKHKRFRLVRFQEIESNL